jgi:glycosyltransferase involved in cell wall biosynthesis
MSNYFPKISIITPSYNQAEFLERTIRSVIDQDYPNLEYIVIDGGSTDGSVDILKKYSRHFAYWVSEPDQGQSAAINKGIKIATGELIAWQNSDDIYYPNTFRSLVANIRNRPNIELVVGNINIIDEYNNVIRDVKYVTPSFGRMIAEGMMVTNQAAFWRKNMHEQIGFMDESLHYAFDYDWFLRLINKCERCLHVDETWGGYRMHGATKTSNNQANFHKENFIILNKHHRMPLWKKRVFQARRLGLMLLQGNFLYVIRGIRIRLLDKIKSYY